MCFSIWVAGCWCFCSPFHSLDFTPMIRSQDPSRHSRALWSILRWGAPRGEAQWAHEGAGIGGWLYAMPCRCLVVVVGNLKKLMNKNVIRIFGRLSFNDYLDGEGRWCTLAALLHYCWYIYMHIYSYIYILTYIYKHLYWYTVTYYMYSYHVSILLFIYLPKIIVSHFVVPSVECTHQKQQHTKDWRWAFVSHGRVQR